MTCFKRWSLVVIAFGLVGVFSARSDAQAADEKAREKYQEAANKGLDWLKKQQQKDGSWSHAGQNPISMTGMAGLAMLCEGSTVSQGKYREEIKKAVDFLIKKSSKNGLIGNPQLQGETGRYMYGHGFALLFLASVYGDEDDKERRAELKEILTRAVVYCGQAQSTQGGWFYTSAKEGHDSDEGSVTVTQMQALRACRNAGIPVPKEIMKKGAGYLHKSTDAQGGVVYSLGRGGGGALGGGRPALTAAAIACIYSAGDYKDDHIKKWFKFCYEGPQKIPLGGPGQARFGFDEYTHFYYAASIYFIGEDGYLKLFPDKAKDQCLTWSKYKNIYFEGILAAQDKTNGGWTGAGGWGSGPIYSTSVYCVILQLENNCLPVFQR